MKIPFKGILEAVRNNTVGEFDDALIIRIKTEFDVGPIEIKINPIFGYDETEKAMTFFNKIVSGFEDVEFDTNTDMILAYDDDIVIEIGASRFTSKHFDFLNDSGLFEKDQRRDIIVYDADPDQDGNVNNEAGVRFNA